MTEQQIQEMAEEVERKIEYRPIPGAAPMDCGTVRVPGTAWSLEVQRLESREGDERDEFAVYMWSHYVEIQFANSSPDSPRYDTPTDAIRAAIAMIDRLETALQGDA